MASSTIFQKYSFFVFLTSLSVVFLSDWTRSASRVNGVWNCLIHPCMWLHASHRSAYAFDSSGVHQGLDLSHILHVGTTFFAVRSSICWMNSVALSSLSGVADCFSEFRY